MDAPPDSTVNVGALEGPDIGTSSASGSVTDATPDRSSMGDFEALSPKVLLLWRFFWAAIGAVIALLAVITGFAAVDLPVAVRIAIPAVVIALVVAFVVLVPSAAYKRWRYRVTHDGLDLEHGLIVREQSSIPHFRVQHVDIRSGLIQRQLGIVSLTISTASPATDAQLPGLDPERAEAIRRRVLDRAEADDGV